jgi:hypothetical protein
MSAKKKETISGHRRYRPRSIATACGFRARLQGCWSLCRIVWCATILA